MSAVFDIANQQFAVSERTSTKEAQMQREKQKSPPLFPFAYPRAAGTVSGAEKIIYSVVCLWFGGLLSLCAQEPLLTGAEGVLPDSGAAELRVSMSIDGGNIQSALHAFSRQTGISIVIGPGVEGEANVRLHDVPWSDALQVLLKPYGYGYRMVGNTVVVNRLENMQQAQQLELVTTRIFDLKYINASDVEKVLTSMLSVRGKLSVLRTTGQKGWKFESSSGARGSRHSRGGASSLGKLARAIDPADLVVKSKALVVTDVRAVLDDIAAVLEEVDQRPQQVLVEVRFLEISSQRLKDIGVEFGSGPGGATSDGVQVERTLVGGEPYGVGVQQVSGSVPPAAFDPSSAGISSTTPLNGGLSILWQQLSGVQYDILFHMLEEDDSANLLSAPRLLTLDNQEATIIVGTKFPIISSEASGEIASVSTTLEYYENIGIQLNVVPQVCSNKFVNMIIHPAVTDQIGTASAQLGGEEGVPLTEYPILSTRETETQILIKSGSTIVMGGLLEREGDQTVIKTPFLGDIPVIGNLFKRKTKNEDKLELLFFVTATIIDDGTADAVAVDPAISLDPSIDVRDRVKAVIKGANLRGRYEASLEQRHVD